MAEFGATDKLDRPSATVHNYKKLGG